MRKIDKNEKVALPIYTPFVEQKNNIVCSTLFGINADSRFLAKLAADTKHCLLFVDIFTSKTYTYPKKGKRKKFK